MKGLQIDLDTIGMFIFGGFVCFVCWGLLSFSWEQSKCEDFCQEKGYPGFRYRAPHNGRHRNSPARCDCLTEQDTKIKNKVPRGVEVDMETGDFVTK